MSLKSSSVIKECFLFCRYYHLKYIHHVLYHQCHYYIYRYHYPPNYLILVHPLGLTNYYLTPNHRLVVLRDSYYMQFFLLRIGHICSLVSPEYRWCIGTKFFCMVSSKITKHHFGKRGHFETIGSGQ